MGRAKSSIDRAARAINGGTEFALRCGDAEGRMVTKEGLDCGDVVTMTNTVTLTPNRRQALSLGLGAVGAVVPCGLITPAYAEVVACLLFFNSIVDQDLEPTKKSFRNIRMPNEQGFHDDDRETAEQALWNPRPCMTNCKVDVTITGRARGLDTNPAADNPRRGVE